MRLLINAAPLLMVVLLWLCVCGAFRTNFHHTRLRTVFRDRSADDLIPIQKLCAQLETTGNNTKTLLNIVKLGEKSHFVGCFQTPDALSLQESGHKKVRGCISEVWLRAEQIDDRVSIVGVADSLMARGLLAVLAESFQDISLNTVLSYNAVEIVQLIPIFRTLPPGRLNGLQNMILEIQHQLMMVKQLSENSSKRGEILNVIDAAEFDGDDRERHSSDVEWRNTPTESTYFPSFLRGVDTSKEVAMLLSGGVDSSVALRLLVDQGFPVRAFYLKIWLDDEISHLNECPWEEDLDYARKVCEQLQVPFEVISLQHEYWREVVQYTLQEARLGRTPNPDVMCNSRIKFGMFYEYVGRYFAFVATGHYAQVEKLGNQVFLKQSPDPVKDQTYFLCNLSQEQLAKAMFPIGHLHKEEVRRLASLFNLPTKFRKDSQGICFLGKLKFDDFIGHYLGEFSGDVRWLETGQVVGRHRGLWFHTIGQRKGIGYVFAQRGVVNDGPWFVYGKDIEKNELIITNNIMVIRAPNRIFQVSNISWINDQPTDLDNGNCMDLLIKMRHAPEILNVSLKLLEGNKKGEISMEIVEKGIAPGQFVAFYSRTTDKCRICLGSAVISRV